MLAATIAHLPVVSSFVFLPCRSVRLLGRAQASPAPADLFEKNRENDEDAHKGALPIRIDPCISRLLRITSSSAAPITAPIGTAFAAHQVGAADHRRSDDAELVAGAERVDRRALPADD